MPRKITNTGILLRVAIAIIMLSVIILCSFAACTPEVDEALPSPSRLMCADGLTLTWQAPEGKQETDKYIVKSNGKEVARVSEEKFTASELPDDVNEVTVSLLRDGRQSKDCEAFVYILKGSNNVTYLVENGKAKASFDCSDFPDDYAEDVVVQSVYNGFYVNEADGIYVRDSKLVLPDSIEIISSLAIDEPLKEFILPKNLKDATGIDTGCEAFKISEENETFRVEDRVLYSKDMQRLEAFPACKQAKEYDMPDSVKFIDRPIISDDCSVARITLSKNLDMHDSAEDPNLFSIFGFSEIIIPANIDIGACLTDAEKIIIEEGVTAFTGALLVTNTEDFLDHTIILPTTLQTLQKNIPDIEVNFWGEALFIDGGTFTIIAENNKYISSWQQWQKGFTVITEEE